VPDGGASNGPIKSCLVRSQDLAARLRELVKETNPAEIQRKGQPAPDSLEAATRQIENLETALERRTVIGQATGLVMERFGLPAEIAFEVLRRLSQEHNRKLYDIAVELVSDGHSAGL
jgi:hypothetical protein